MMDSLCIIDEGGKMFYQDNEGRKYTAREISMLTDWQFQELGIKPI
jgi:hypothetical protein